MASRFATYVPEQNYWFGCCKGVIMGSKNIKGRYRMAQLAMGNPSGLKLLPEMAGKKGKSTIRDIFFLSLFSSHG